MVGEHVAAAHRSCHVSLICVTGSPLLAESGARRSHCYGNRLRPYRSRTRSSYNILVVVTRWWRRARKDYEARFFPSLSRGPQTLIWPLLLDVVWSFSLIKSFCIIHCQASFFYSNRSEERLALGRRPIGGSPYANSLRHAVWVCGARATTGIRICCA